MAWPARVNAAMRVQHAYGIHGQRANSAARPVYCALISGRSASTLMATRNTPAAHLGGDENQSKALRLSGHSPARLPHACLQIAHSRHEGWRALALKGLSYRPYNTLHFKLAARIQTWRGGDTSLSPYPLYSGWDGYTKGRGRAGTTGITIFA